MRRGDPSAGSPLFVESLGADPPGRRPAPLVLVHGFGAHNHFWRRWAPELALRRRIHMVELMGFGRAATPTEGDYTPQAQAAHLVAWIRQNVLRPPVLIGHSLGGAVVLLAALRMLDEETGGRDPETPRPEELAGLVLISGAVYPQRLPPYLSKSRIPGLGELLLLVPPPRWALRLGIGGIVHDRKTISREQVDGYAEPLRSRARRRAILRAARQLQPEVAHEVSPRYREVSLPILALWGAEDPVVPPDFARRLERELPNARAVLLSGVGHLPPEEAPERSLAAVQAFLEELEA